MSSDAFSVSAIMPVHNEETLLPYSLASLTFAPIDELCVVFDNCTDKSLSLFKRWLKEADPNFHVVWKEKTVWQPKWQSHIAQVATECFEMATGDVVYGLAADIIFLPTTSTT